MERSFSQASTYPEQDPTTQEKANQPTRKHELEEKTRDVPPAKRPVQDFTDQEQGVSLEEATRPRTHHPTDSQEELRDLPPREKPTDITHHTSMSVVPLLEELVRDVPPEKLNQACTDEHLCEIALSVTEWQSVAPFLGLTKAEQEEIERDCRGTWTQRIEMLRRWRQKFVRRATYRRLAELLHKLEQTTPLETFCALLGSRSDTITLVSYATYLERRYQTETPAFLTLQWPPPPTRKVFNLAMILQTTVWYAPIDEEFIRLTLWGNVDDIMERKTPVKVEDIFKLDREAHVLSNEVGRKLILIEGAPGAGKSTLAWHIPQKWARGELFQEFKVVVFIQLRDPKVQAAQSLTDLLPAKDGPTAEKNGN